MDKMFDTLSFNLELKIILLANAVIMVKNPFDILQGISKLDSIIKISIFQRRKIPLLKDTLSTDIDKGSESEKSTSRLNSFNYIRLTGLRSTNKNASIRETRTFPVKGETRGSGVQSNEGDGSRDTLELILED